jgi:poly(3-hydroxybutyrate) depolymerase
MVCSSIIALLCASLAQSQSVPFTEGLGITVPGNARTPVRVDVLEYQMVKNTFAPPKAGDSFQGRPWESLKANAEGWFSGAPLRGGYLFSEIDMPQPGWRLLEAVGHGMVYVNGEPHAGDPYEFGYVSTPVYLKAGRNQFIFAGGRGRLKAELKPVPGNVWFDLRDATLPDDLGSGKAWAGVRIGALTPGAELTVRAKNSRGKIGAVRTYTYAFAALNKLPVELVLDGKGKYTVEVLQKGKVVAASPFTLRVRKPTETHRRTFISQIDGSVQYFAVNPPPVEGPGKALILSLHGASVEAQGQAEAYSAKDWAYLVAPTNRRPFGFDWEDIGRLDAMEVLNIAQSMFKSDKSRTYLTGHSMGGHGTWQLGAHFPDRFAAIGPSAGWISFWTYAGGANFPEPTPLEALIRRSMSPSDTLALKSNFNHYGIYVLHGDADDNVPVAQARTMRQELEGHPDLKWHEQPGAGHWWDDDQPGAACVDWKPMWDLFQTRTIPKNPLALEFATSNPGVSGTFHWATVELQEKAFERSTLKLTLDPSAKELTGQTVNIARLTLDLRPFQMSEAVKVRLNGTTFEAQPKGGQLYLEKSPHGWRAAGAPDPRDKNAVRSGGYKDVFRNRVVFVYGSAGTPEENAWALAKARYDAETLAYRGNGFVEVVPCSKFDLKKYADRNVVLYGHRDMNSKVEDLVDFQVAVGRGAAWVGLFNTVGDAGVLAIRPRKDSKIASVGLVCGTTLVGMKTLDRVPFFTSGASMPDVLVYSPEALRLGTKGMVGGGFFGNDWLGESGEFVFPKD